MSTINAHQVIVHQCLLEIFNATFVDEHFYQVLSSPCQKINPNLSVIDIIVADDYDIIRFEWIYKDTPSQHTHTITIGDSCVIGQLWKQLSQVLHTIGKTEDIHTIFAYNSCSFETIKVTTPTKPTHIDEAWLPVLRHALGNTTITLDDVPDIIDEEEVAMDLTIIAVISGNIECLYENLSDAPRT